MKNNKELTEKEKIDLQRDISITDILLRLTTLERILIKKKLITDDEFGKVMQEVLNEMEKLLKNQGYDSIASLFSGVKTTSN